MSKARRILLLEDEPLILMDLEFAVEDAGCAALSAATPDAAMRLLDDYEGAICVAILDITLGRGKTSFPVARELELRQIPYILHSGDLDRHNERIRDLKAPLVPKPASADDVVAAALRTAEDPDAFQYRDAAE